MDPVLSALDAAPTENTNVAELQAVVRTAIDGGGVTPDRVTQAIIEAAHRRVIDPGQTVALHAEPFVHRCLAMRVRPDGATAYPDVDMDAARFSNGNPFYFCPAVLVSLGLLDADVHLDNGTLERTLLLLQREGREGRALQDALPHNIGYRQLLLHADGRTLEGHDPAVFDQKKAVQCPLQAPTHPRLNMRLRAAWAWASCLASACDEYARQARLQTDQGRLYAQWFQQVALLRAPARSHFLETTDLAIKLKCPLAGLEQFLSLDDTLLRRT